MTKAHHTAAVEIVCAALQSKSILLIGNNNSSVGAAQSRAKGDAAYLAQLVSDLSEAIKKLD